MALLALDRSPSGSTRFAGGRRAGLLGPGRVKAFHELFFVRTLEASGIASAEAAGTPGVVLVLQPGGIASGEAMGTPGVVLVLAPTGIPSGETLGTPAVYQPSLQVLEPTGIPSEEAAGAPAVSQSWTSRVSWARRLRRRGLRWWEG